MPLLITLIATSLLMLPGCAGGPAVVSPGPAEGPPNIVLILADDLGIECLSMYGGSSHLTPNLDRLASQGMRFTHCFSNPYCSPSRAELLTGRYPYANGIKEVIYDLDRHQNLILETDEPSFARQLQAAGYTTAIAGKWQLSFLHQNNTINAFGFDQYQCWQIFDDAGNKTTRFHHPHFIRNGAVIHDEIAQRYGPEVNAAFLIDFIQNQAANNRPFLAYYTCLLPHFPWVPTPDSKDKRYVFPNATHKGDPRYFPDMVRYLDHNVGRLMLAIEKAGVADNTVVIFVADNGTQQGLTNVWGDGRVVHGGKGTMTDLGTRVPLILRWPGKVEPGTVSGDMVDFVDFLPTLCEIAAAPLPDQTIHGQSFLPQLLGEPHTPREWIHVQDKTQRHIRSGTHILTDNGQLRPVVGPAMRRGTTIQNLTREDVLSREVLQHVLDELGD